VTIRTSVHPVEWHAKGTQTRPAPGTRVLLGDHRVRLPAASREVLRASVMPANDGRVCLRSSADRLHLGFGALDVHKPPVA
jgi:hypothetical protein